MLFCRIVLIYWAAALVNHFTMTLRLLTDAAGCTMSVLDVDGFLVPYGIKEATPEQSKQKFLYVPEFKCRDDDIMLLSYPKTGTNWLNEVITKLLFKTPEKPVINKVATMLEFQTQEEVDMVPSPRCLNTHVAFKYIPKELKEKQLRTVLVVRNPKDALVSYFNHIKGIRKYGYNGEWKDWFQLYIKGEMEYGTYWDYLKQIEAAMEEGIGFPFHVIYYEDLKLNGSEEVKKLAKFLCVDVDDDICQKIVDQCSFDNMKTKQIVPDEMREKLFHDEFNFFRKGEVGDWQNWFTVAQNEQFDKLWETEMAGSKFIFTYTQT